MPIDIERGLLAHYAARVLADPSLPMPAAVSILSWFKDRIDLMDFAPPAPLAKTLAKVRKKGRITSKCERAFLAARTDYLCQIQALAAAAPEPGELKRNIAMVLEAFHLPQEAFELLLLCAAHERWFCIDSFVYRLQHAVGGVSYPLSLLTTIERAKIEKMIAPGGELDLKGVVQLKTDSDELVGRCGRLRQRPRIDEQLDLRFESLTEFRGALLGAPAQASLTMDGFSHAGAKCGLLLELLRGWVRTPCTGVNILLYGPPGSGKTELAKTASHAAQLALYMAGENASTSTEPSRKTRLGDLVFTEQLLRTSKSSAILFDELEDVAIDLLKRGGSKLFLNRLLERNAVPVIWTSNNVASIDPAVIRRMTVAIELKAPPRCRRAEIWRRISDRLDAKLSDTDCSNLGDQISAEPAVIHNAVLATKLAGGGTTTAKRAATDLLAAMGNVSSGCPPREVGFDAALAPADLDLAQLTQDLVSAGTRQLSICLSGPPGTGKSAYARHLADELGLEMMKLRASDLLDMWVGATEQRIAQAFRDAADQGAFLFFDEADSLLSDRQHAHRSWEVSQVNEMLTWMEDHPMPFCCATNLVDKLDPASMRRFTFHVKFTFLDRAGIKRAWQAFFGLKAPRSSLDLTNLTPGDFAQTMRRAEVLGTTNDRDALARMLAEASAAKPSSIQQIGFTAG